MGRKIWTRAHEESKINLRPVFQPDSSGRMLSPVDSYQNIQPVGYSYATRQLIQDQAEAKRAVAELKFIYKKNVMKATRQLIQDQAEAKRAVADYRRAHGSCNTDAVRNQGLFNMIQ